LFSRRASERCSARWRSRLNGSSFLEILGKLCPDILLTTLFVFFMKMVLDILFFYVMILPMQLEALKVFCDIARYRSFSEAAVANELSQPAVTRVVQQLENRLHAQLIDRSKRPLELTTVGQTYYEGCKVLLEQYQQLEESIRHAQAELALHVRVAAIYSVGLGDINQLVERFQAAHPETKVEIAYVHPNLVYEKVLEGTVDFGLVSFPRTSRELAVLPWREEEMVLVCPPGHPLAELQSVALDQLAGERFIAFDKGLVIRREVDRFLHRHGVEVQVVHEFDNIENIKKGIEVGAGVGLLPEPMLQQEVRAGTLRAVRLAGCQLVRPLGIIHRRSAQQPRLGSAAVRFINLLRGGDTSSTYPEDDVVPPNGNHASHNGRQSRRKKRTVS
jgi:DNA-binding transcriptional LysR family regulator